MSDKFGAATKLGRFFCFAKMHSSKSILGVHPTIVMRRKISEKSPRWLLRRAHVQNESLFIAAAH